jgi:DNA repair protein RecO (recombination protein O)
MQWEDDAIVMHTTRFGERDARASVLTHQFGRHHAIIKGGGSKQGRADWQAGNLLRVHWYARLPEHMGSIRGEVLRPFAALLLQDALALTALSSACALCERILQERDPHPRFYQAFLSLLESISSTTVTSLWLADYVRMELVLLSEAGYGLDLSCCAATGNTENLVYVSPRSGRAVSQHAGHAWHDKLLPLPAFVLEDKAAVTNEQLLEGLRLSEYFLHHWVYAPLGYALPQTRQRLINHLANA